MVMGQDEQATTRPLDPRLDESAADPRWDQSEPDMEIDLRKPDQTSRYVRRSGRLPHLTDDPAWVPAPGDLPRAAEPARERRFSWPGRRRRNR